MLTKPLSMQVKLLLGFISIIILLVGYGALSYEMHLKNPDDTTIPTYRQMTFGIDATFEELIEEEDVEYFSIHRDGIKAEGIQVKSIKQLDGGQVNLVTIAGGQEKVLEFVKSRNFEVYDDDRKIVGFRFKDGKIFITEQEHRKGGLVKMFEINDAIGERWVIADFKATSYRLLLGILYGMLGAVVFAILMGCFGYLEAFFLPPIEFFARIPPTATMAIFFVLVGLDTSMFVSVICFGIMPTFTRSIHLAVKDVPMELIYKYRTLGASEFEVISRCIFRHILPRVIDNIRLAIGPAMVFLVAAEMLVGNVGFGYRIRMQQKLLAMDVVYPYIMLLGFYGLVLDLALQYMQRRLCPWFHWERR